MDSIPLPLTRCMRLLAFSAVSFSAALVGMAPIEPGWRLAALAVTLLVGLVSWRRYLSWRPAVLHVEPDRRLSCTLAADRRVEVRQLCPGVIAPGLAMATLIGQDGSKMPLVVPASSLDADAHWRLRRALLAWQPGAEAGEGVQPGSAG